MEEHIDDNDITMHFENIQSTNWNSLRFKPPPAQNSKIGWRVEFRTMDI
jgi:glutamate--cysteine ligase catalytic subunit